MVFIAHDLSIVRYVSDQIMVLYMGQIMELSTCKQLFEKPLHPYTKALLQSIPIADPDLEKQHTERGLRGEPISPLQPLPGCPFSNRCPYAQDRCHNEKPVLRTFENRQITCHRAEEIASGQAKIQASTL